MNELQIFEHEKLGYSNLNEAISDHVDAENKLNSKMLSSCAMHLGQRGQTQ
jgi:hypothetical protein